MKLTLPAGNEVPVLLLLFNRPTHTEQLINALRKIKPTNIFVNIDGPRHKRDLEKITECKKQIAAIDWACEVHTNYNQSNLGCRDSVIGGINWFFKYCEAGIILEDDCIPSESFFPFCKLMLEKYRDDKRVMQISGSNYVATQFDYTGEYYFSALHDIWGWATWRRAWEEFSRDLSDLERMISSGCLGTYTGNKQASEWLQKYLVAAQNPNCSIWSSYWTYAMIKANALSIVPPVNLIENIGFDAEGASGSFESFTKYNQYKTSVITEVTEPVFFYPNRKFDAVRFQLIKRTDPFFFLLPKIMHAGFVILHFVRLYHFARTIYRFIKRPKSL